MTRLEIDPDDLMLALTSTSDRLLGRRRYADRFARLPAGRYLDGVVFLA